MELGQSVPRRGRGTKCPEVQWQNARQDDDLRLKVGLLQTEDDSTRSADSDNSGPKTCLTRRCLGRDTGVRHSRHGGKQTLSVLVTGGG